MLVPRFRVVCCLLALSAGLNIWLLLQRAPTTHPETARATDRSPDSRRPATSVALRASGDLLGSCNRQLVAVNQALASATEERAQQIEPRKRFEAGTRQPGMETRMSPLVEKAVANLSGVKQYPLECRADLCQV